jgi:hypothetical protein
MFSLIFSLMTSQIIKTEPDLGPAVRAICLFQALGTPEVLGHDSLIKARLAKSISNDRFISFTEVEGLISRDTYTKIAGEDGQLDDNEIRNQLDSLQPESRRRLTEGLSQHADLLTTQFDMIDDAHRQGGKRLAQWIINHYKPGQPLHITVVCTGNSRRSMIGSSMGNLAAAYYGMPEIQFHSGGTAPTAFNKRTIQTLKSIGFSIEPTGAEAPRGDPQSTNPIYLIGWGQGLETREFSKHYADKANPQSGFAALMVCTEADAECPLVKGAAIRISMPYLDPKMYDDSRIEAAKYAERRDDIGRLMLFIMAQVRQECLSNKK